MTKLKNFFADAISNFEIPIPPTMVENLVVKNPVSEISPRENFPPASACKICSCPAIWESIYRDSVFRCLTCDPPPPKFTARILHLATDLADDSPYWLENNHEPRSQRPDTSDDPNLDQRTSTLSVAEYETFTRVDRDGITHTTHVHRSLIEIDWRGRLSKIRLAG